QRKQVADRAPPKKNLVVLTRGELGAAVAVTRQPRPVRRIDDSLDQLTLNVALEKALWILVEEPLAVECIRQCREAAARHAGDQVDLVEQRVMVPVDHDRRPPQLLEHAVGKSCGTSSAA